MMAALTYFRDAWIATLVGLIVFLISSLIVSIEDVSGLVRVALWAIGLFGFSTSTLAWIAAGVNIRLGLKALRPKS